MRNRLMTATAVAVLFALGACASDEAAAPKKEAMAAPMKKETAMALKIMSAEEMAKEFAKGSIACKWTSADGKTEGEDFFFKNASAMAGDMDRNIGDKTIQGSWKVLGPGLWIKAGTGKKLKGTWMNLVKTGKKSYDAYDSAKNKVMSMKC